MTPRPPLLAIALLSLSIPAAAWRAEVARKTRKVVLVSLDGAADWLLDDFLARGVLPPDGAFGRMTRQGTRAEAMVPVDDSLTAVAHAAMFTGTFPDRNGIVSNQFLPPGGPIFPPLNGFDAPLLAETLWSAARRQGKRVVCIATPSADAASPDRTCGLTLPHGRTLGRARRLDLTPAAGTGSAGAPSFEHARALGARGTGSEGAASLDYRLSDGSSAPLHAFAVDTASDGSERYDALVLDFDADLENGYAARIRRSEWTRLSLPAREKEVGAWVKLIELAGDLSAVTIYLGVPAQNRGAPAAFVGEITERFGPWPGAPEAGPRSDGSIDETLWREQAARLNGFLEGIAEHALRRYDWDLMTVYLPLLDEAGHLFLLRDPRQLDYGSEDGALRERYAGHVEWAYAAADGALRRWMAAAPPETDFVVVSDHGMVPAYAEVLVNVILGRAGLRVTQDLSTEVRGFGTGGTGQIHVNVAGRQEGGVVPAAKLDEYVQRIVDACKDVREPLTGEPAFAAVLKRSELGRLRLGHARNSPDVWVSARPGLTVRSVMGVQQPVFRPLRAGGQHGYLGSNREVQAIFFAAGPDIPPAYIRPVRQIDVAATVAALLGIEPPADNEGRDVLK